MQASDICPRAVEPRCIKSRSDFMGTLNIIDWCAKNGNPPPVWAEQAGSVYVAFQPASLPDVLTGAAQVAAQVTAHVGAKSGPSRVQVETQRTGEVAGEVQRLLATFINSPMTRLEAQKILGLKGQANFRDRYLQPALNAKLIEMTIPDKPRSSKQRYRLTEKGRDLLASSGTEIQ